MTTKLNSKWLDVTGNVSHNSNKITDLAPGVNPADGVNVSQLTSSEVHTITQLEFGATTSGTIKDGALVIDTTSNSANVVEDLNELLGYLVPSAAPNLSSFSSTAGVTGKLSFGASNVVAGYTNHPALDINATYTSSGNTRGIINNTTNPTGTLADNVAAHAYAYPAYAFGNADKGILYLKVNGSTVHSVDLSTFGSGASMTGSSGFTLGAATAVSFQGGGTFPARKYRTGTWIVNTADLNNGYATIVVEHVVSGTTYSTQTINYVTDAETVATSFASESLAGLSMSGSNQISGITYHTSGSAQYNLTVSNAYRDTYSSSGTAVSHPTTTNCSVSSAAIGNMADETDDISIASKAVTVDTGRILPSYQGGSGNRLTVSTSILRTVQTTQTSTSTTNYYLLLDSNSTDTATALAQYFVKEGRRFLSSSDFGSTSSSPDYTEATSLLTLTNELQCYNTRLVYPSYDFSSVANGPANPNYSTASGTKYFYGYFTDATATGTFRFTINGSGLTLVDLLTFNAASAHVTMEIKLPTQTGWLDCMKAFETDQWGDGYGCYSASLGNDTTIPTTNLGATVGTKSTANSGNRIYYRIKMGAGAASGYLTQVSVVWNAS
jgi:hypothetical protein